MDRKNKVDKGFELVYWNLSYRRKFIRSLWLLPLTLLVPLYVYVKLGSIAIPAAAAILLAAIDAVQITYNYRKWKGGQPEE